MECNIWKVFDLAQIGKKTEHGPEIIPNCRQNDALQRCMGIAFSKKQASYKGNNGHKMKGVLPIFP